MSVEIRVPPLGESVVEATVGQWTKPEGAAVKKGEVLVELETDKITVEVSADQDGVLGKIEKREGETVGVGDLLGVLNAGDAASAAPAPAPAAAPASAPAAQATAPASSPAPAAAQTSPAARVIAAEQGIDISTVPGTGPNARVTKSDVVNAAAGQATGGQTAQPSAPAAAPSRAPEPATPAAPSARSDRETRERMSRRRQTIARRLVEAQQTTASLTTFNEVDLSKVFELRKRRQDAFVKKHGLKLGFMSFFTRAVVGALRQFPRLNAEIQGDEIVLKHYYDIGIAVGTDEGLVVPVVRDADKLSFAEIERKIGELAGRAREGKLTLDELRGGSFTITNGGTYGSMLSTPILNPPQVGILGMHNIVERAVVVDGKIEIRPMMYIAMTYDHRIVDGSEAVRFLVAVKQMIEDPETMLLEG
ncbi:MAG: 2-oxoglutarate dehydrogenase complex dihydrolipoyllysine-residue succinyltransferase [Gemmatimonadota bacterium]|jgi:2-oxoglutarate dehydrogenase E2 component (dihydrolipoamide succinyltransferase)|nr:2-oxoglutarate dehydrogenase complex dihydrolipoyllysine-residue succinyltransferase [Gemmatimonadota bacterium]